MSLTRRNFVRTLFAASQAALASRLMTTSLYAFDPSVGALNFAVIGDWGRRGRPDQAEVAKQMAITCKQAGAAFVVSVGDNFYEDGVASVTDSHWQQSFERVYSEPSLQVPWYVILGNHDYHGNTEAQLEYGKTHPRWIMPARHYSKVFAIDAATNLECFFIDTSPMIGEYKDMPIMQSIHTQDVAGQLKWLDESLQASKAQWKFVIGHHPIYSAGVGHGNQEEMIKMVLPILHKNEVQAYFAGHDHDLQHLRDEDLDLYISGAGSEHRPVKKMARAAFGESTSGFILVSVRRENMHVRYYDNLGNMVYTTTATQYGQA